MTGSLDGILSSSDWRLGVLVTDPLNAELIAAHGDYPSMFRTLFAQADVASERLLTIDALADSLPEPAFADAYLVTGSVFSVYDERPWIPRLEDFLRRAIDQRRPVIGICFGHQLLAQALGGQVGAAEQGWQVGVQQYQVTEQRPWMQPPLKRYRTLASHQDQVLSLPSGAVLLARGADCPVAAFEVPPFVLAIQGHPEFGKRYAAARLSHRRALLGPACYEAALATLTEQTDSAVLAQWLCNFIDLARS